MYDIGMVFKIFPNPGHTCAVDEILTGVIVGYSFADKQPKHVVLWYRNGQADGEFGLSFLSTHELAVKTLTSYGGYEKCDLTAFVKASESLKASLAVISKKEEELEEGLDALRHDEDAIRKQMGETEQ